LFLPRNCKSLWDSFCASNFAFWELDNFAECNVSKLEINEKKDRQTDREKERKKEREKERKKEKEMRNENYLQYY